MMRSVYLKTLYDRRFFTLGWTVGLGLLGALMTSFYPAMHQDGVIDSLLQNLPAAFQGLVGNLSDLSTFPTYLASQLFDIRLPLIAGIMAIILGLGLSVADEEKGELRTMLSLPVSRTSLLLQKWLAMVSILICTLVGLVAGVYLVMPFIEGASIDLDKLALLVAMTGLLMATLGTIPFAVGSITGKRAIATAASTLVIIGSFILSTFSQAVDWLSDYEKLSLLHYFPAVNIVKGIYSSTDVIVLVVVMFVFLIAAIIMFRRRDVA